MEHSEHSVEDLGGRAMGHLNPREWRYLREQIRDCEIVQKSIPSRLGANQSAEPLNVTRALMEMKHLGSTLRLAVCVPGLQLLGL